MLTDEQLNIIGEAIRPLFQYLEHEVIMDVARRIGKTLSYTRTAELQALAMRDLGYSPARIRKEAMRILNADPQYRKVVAKHTLEYKKEIKDIINGITKEAYKANDDIVSSAGNMSWVDDLSVWKQAGKSIDNTYLPQLVVAIAEQTASELKNITQTGGFKTMSGYESIENLYKRELDKAVIKVCSGTFTPERVLKDCVHELCHSGLRSIDYASGRSMQIDTAAALALRTGCNQLAGEVTNNNIEQTGENLVYVSAHWGARNKGEGIANHEQWQGKVYYIQSGHDYKEEAERIGQSTIENLYNKTGYALDGEHESNPLGLHGYNCRHEHFVFFEGVSTKPKITPEPKPVEINGKTYDYYAMTQKMRSMEREVRAHKREAEALKSLGMDDATEKAKASECTRRYKEFCQQCNVRPATNRLRYEAGSSDIKKTKAYKDYTNIIENAQKNGIIGTDAEVVESIRTNIVLDSINEEKQLRHFLNHKGYVEGRSYLYGDMDSAKDLYNSYRGKGIAQYTSNGKWRHLEIVDCGKVVGVDINPKTGTKTEVTEIKIHYSKTGSHIVPKGKGEK